jgi:hypothetical protein
MSTREEVRRAFVVDDSARAKGIRCLGQILQGLPVELSRIPKWTVKVLERVDRDFGECRLERPNLLVDFLETKEGKDYGKPISVKNTGHDLTSF